MVAIIKNIRHQTIPVQVGNIIIGGTAPIVIQSMTNTDTADIEKTLEQILMLYQVGSEVVRITVNNDEAAKAVPYIKAKLLQQNCNIPIVGCFHYNGHKLLTDYPDLASSLDKYRINPGNIGVGNKRDKNFETIIECAIKNNKPIRIGVNWGSLDQELLARLMDKNALLPSPQAPDIIMRQVLIESALTCAKYSEKVGLTSNKIILSAKVSRVHDLIVVYQELARRSKYPLHLGLTEAGMGSKGIIATTAALSILLQQGIGDTIRASLTPEPGASREQEVTACQQILQSLEIRSFAPQITSCPGCGRTTNIFFQQLAKQINIFIKENMPQWKTKYPGVEKLNIAVMGCIVNGPGESKHADIGISLPGSGESPIAPVFIDGEKVYTLRGENIVNEFKEILMSYIEDRYAKYA